MFTRHYAEMLAAMFLGMIVLGGLLSAVVGFAGGDYGALEDDAPALLLLAMALNMSVPMVAWMRYRGHAWRLTYEMTVAMLVPALAAIALLWTGAVTKFGTLMMLLHVAMLAAMLLAMLARRDEYSHEHRRTPHGD